MNNEDVNKNLANALIAYYIKPVEKQSEEMMIHTDIFARHYLENVPKDFSADDMLPLLIEKLQPVWEIIAKKLPNELNYIKDFYKNLAIEGSGEKTYYVTLVCSVLGHAYEEHKINQIYEEYKINQLKADCDKMIEHVYGKIEEIDTHGDKAKRYKNHIPLESKEDKYFPSKIAVENYHEDHRIHGLVGQYNKIMELRATLTSDKMSDQKLDDFKTFISEPKNRTTIMADNDPFIVRAMKRITNALSLGAVSILAKGRHQFFYQSRGKDLVDTAENHLGMRNK